MNNFEIDEQAQILSDTLTPYALARRVIELEEAAKELTRIKMKYGLLKAALSSQGIDAEEVVSVFEIGCGL